MGSSLSTQRLYWGAAISAGLMVLGAFGPWARALFITVSGVDGDGWFVIAAAAVAGVVLFRGCAERSVGLWGAVVMGAMAGLGLLVAYIDGRDIFGNQGGDEDDLFGTADLVQPQWGLLMTIAASLGLLLASIGLAMSARRAAAERHPSAATARPPQIGPKVDSHETQESTADVVARVAASIGEGDQGGQARHP